MLLIGAKLVIKRNRLRNRQHWILLTHPAPMPFHDGRMYMEINWAKPHYDVLNAHFIDELGLF